MFAPDFRARRFGRASDDEGVGPRIPGGEVVCVATSLGAVGMSICYDLRFPELYRLRLRGRENFHRAKLFHFSYRRGALGIVDKLIENGQQTYV